MSGAEFRAELKRTFNEKANNHNEFDILFPVMEYHASIKEDKTNLGELSTYLNLREWKRGLGRIASDYNLLVCM